MQEKSCCFFGHRKIEITDTFKITLYNTIKKLIIEENVSIFYFGNKSQFNDICYSVVCELKKLYPHIKRVYVRAQFPVISKNYEAYLLEKYEETYYPHRVINAGKASYIKRNYEMIENSTFCVIYYDENYIPPARKNSNTLSESGTKIAFKYAMKQKKILINLCK